MNPLHVHLLINHLPVFGTLLGIVVLMLALWRRSEQIESVAYFLFIISSLGAVISYLTGEGAEEAVEHIQGISKTAIERHEDFAIYPLLTLILLGVVSVVGIILIQEKSRLVGKIRSVLLILAVISFVLIAWAGYLGGQIRHTELQKGNQDQSRSYQDENLKQLP